MKIAYFWMTPGGEQLVRRLREQFPGIPYGSEAFPRHVRDAFGQADALVFVMAAGIVVRTIAPLIRSKETDPAVVVLDQAGRYAISLLSGHWGGANQLARDLAAFLGGEAVITTATDVQDLPAFDAFARINHLRMENPDAVKAISSALLRGEPVGVQTAIPLREDFAAPQVRVSPDGTPGEYYQVQITNRTAARHQSGVTLYLRPVNLVLGIGCKKGISPQHLGECIRQFLGRFQLSPLSLAKFATIPLKQEEPAIRQICGEMGLPLEIVPEEAIRSCGADVEKSAFVEQVTGVPSVAEACSILASGGGCRITGKVKYEGVTLAASEMPLPPLLTRLDGAGNRHTGQGIGQAGEELQ